MNFHFMASLLNPWIGFSEVSDTLTENKPRTESKMILELLICTSVNTVSISLQIHKRVNSSLIQWFRIKYTGNGLNLIHLRSILLFYFCSERCKWFFLFLNECMNVNYCIIVNFQLNSACRTITEWRQIILLHCKS